MYPPYEPFSIDPIKDITRIARAGALREEAPLFCKAGHTLLGTGLGFTVGEPPDVEPVFGANDVPVEKLEECHAALKESQALSAGEVDEHGNPIVAALVQVLMQALLTWIQNRKAGS